jgi:hypothetical protein
VVTRRTAVSITMIGIQRMSILLALNQANGVPKSKSLFRRFADSGRSEPDRAETGDQSRHVLGKGIDRR